MLGHFITPFSRFPAFFFSIFCPFLSFPFLLPFKNDPGITRDDALCCNTGEEEQADGVASLLESLLLLDRTSCVTPGVRILEPLGQAQGRRESNFSPSHTFRSPRKNLRLIASFRSFPQILGFLKRVLCC
jgi:hypothetical protein